MSLTAHVRFKVEQTTNRRGSHIIEIPKNLGIKAVCTEKSARRKSNTSQLPPQNGRCIATKIQIQQLISWHVKRHHFMQLKRLSNCSLVSNRTAQRVQMVPLPCVRTPEQPPVTAMTNAIRIVLAPSPRNTGLQILIFEASRQHLSQESRQRTRGNARQQVSQPNMKRDASVLLSPDPTIELQAK